MGKNIEIFSADCPLCRETVANVKKAVTDKGCGCDINVHVCSGDECGAPAKQYGIKSVPTIVIDGEIKKTGKVSVEEAAALL